MTHILPNESHTVTDFLQACNLRDCSSLPLQHDLSILGGPQESDLLKAMNPDGVIVGVNPAIQPMIAQRLEQAGYPTIRWDDLITM